MKYIIYLLTAGCLLLGGCTSTAPLSPEGASPQKEGATEEQNNLSGLPEAYSDGHIEKEEFDAVVTVKLAENGSVYFQIDSVSRLYPLNYEQPYTGAKRLACRLVEYKESTVDQNKDYHLGIVKWYEDVALGEVEAEGVEMAPDDGINLLDDWMTSLNDAFLTVHYSTSWGDGTVEHRLVLEKTGPAGFRLRHYRNGDEYLQEGDALICFDLNTYLPQTEGMDITLKWSTGAGEQSEKTFRFSSRP